MAKVPLGKSAHNRGYGEQGEIKLVNRFFEQDPANLVDQTALLSRPATRHLLDVGPGPVRKMHTRSGAFNGDMFVISGRGVYRVGVDGEIIQIAGTISGLHDPGMSIAVGPGYEHLFIADGEDLWIYEGKAFARATLSTVDDPSATVSAGDKIQIGDTWYEWVTGDVDLGDPDGTEANPWRVLLGTAKASAVLRFIAEGPILINTAMFLGLIPEGTPPGEGGDLREVYRGSRDDELERNNPQGTGDNPWRLAFFRGQTRFEYLDLLRNAINATGTPGLDYSRALVDPNTHVSGDEISVKTILAGGGERLEGLTVRAREGGEAGNDIQCRSVLSDAQNLRWEDKDGNPTLSLTGGSDLANDIPSALEKLGQAVDDTGIPGVDYSTNLVTNPDVTVQFNQGGVIRVRSRTTSEDTFINVSTTSTGIEWDSSVLTGGGEHRLDLIPLPDGNPAADVATLAGFTAVTVTGSDRFYWLRPGERDIRPLDFATAESEPDELVNVTTLNDQLLLMGSTTVEFWSPSGIPELPFKPSRGQTLNTGALKGTTTKLDDSIAFVGPDGVVYATKGGPVERLSNNAVEEQIREQIRSIYSVPGINMWNFGLDGHRFLSLSLDTEAPPDPELPPVPPSPKPVAVVQSNTSVSPYIDAWRVTPEGTFGDKYDPPTDAGLGKSIAVFPFKNHPYIAVLYIVPPYVAVYEFDIETGFGSRVADPDVAWHPNFEGAEGASAMAVHPSGRIIAVTRENVVAEGPKTHFYKFDPDTGSFTGTVDTSLQYITNQYPRSVAFSARGDLLFQSNASGFNAAIHVYEIDVNDGIIGKNRTQTNAMGLVGFDARMGYRRKYVFGTCQGDPGSDAPHIYRFLYSDSGISEQGLGITDTPGNYASYRALYDARDTRFFATGSNFRVYGLTKEGTWTSPLYSHDVSFPKTGADVTIDNSLFVFSRVDADLAPIMYKYTESDGLFGLSQPSVFQGHPQHNQHAISFIYKPGVIQAYEEANIFPFEEDSS